MTYLGRVRAKDVFGMLWEAWLCPTLQFLAAAIVFILLALPLVWLGATREEATGLLVAAACGALGYFLGRERGIAIGRSDAEWEARQASKENA